MDRQTATKTTSTAFLDNIDEVVLDGVTYAASHVATCVRHHEALLRKASELTARNAQLAGLVANLSSDVWLIGSRFNCLVLGSPTLPLREYFRDNSEFLRACEAAVDGLMGDVVRSKGKKGEAP